MKSLLRFEKTIAEATGREEGVCSLYMREEGPWIVAASYDIQLVVEIRIHDFL